jgi:hypothetical protein
MVEAVRNNRIAALQQTLRSRGAGRILVVKPGQLGNLKGIESLSRFPNLHRELADFIGARLGITVTDILCDAEGRLPILAAANPSFVERLRNSGGNLEALGHKVVLEMEDENSGKLILIKSADNCSLASATQFAGPPPRMTIPPHKFFPPASRKTETAGPVDPKVVWDAIKELKGVNVMGKEFSAGPYQVKIGRNLVAADDSILELTLEVADQVKVKTDAILPSFLPLILTFVNEQIKLEAHYPRSEGSYSIIGFGTHDINRVHISDKVTCKSDHLEPFHFPIIDYEFSIDSFNPRLLIRPLIRSINESRTSEALKKLTSSLVFIFSGASEEANVYKDQIGSELKNIEGLTGSLPDPSAKEAINSALDRITAALRPLKINWELAESIDGYIKKIDGFKQIIRAFEDIN